MPEIYTCSCDAYKRRIEELEGEVERLREDAEICADVTPAHGATSARSAGRRLRRAGKAAGARPNVSRRSTAQSRICGTKLKGGFLNEQENLCR